MDLLSVKFLTQRVATKYSPQGPQGKKYVTADSQKWFPTVYLVTQNHSISTVGQTIVGPTPFTDITAHQQWMIGCQTRSSTGEVHMDTDTKTHAVCPTCQFTDTDTKCALQTRCGGWYHQRCNPTPRSTVCTACLPRNATAQFNNTAPLTPDELAHLNDATGRIYSSTDGSVLEIFPPRPPTNLPHQSHPKQIAYKTRETQKRRHPRRWHTRRSHMPKLRTPYRRPPTCHRRLPSPPAPRRTISLRHQQHNTHNLVNTLQKGNERRRMATQTTPNHA